MAFITALSILLGGDLSAVPDRDSLEEVSIRIRLLFVSKGMSQAKVADRLGLGNRTPTSSPSTVSNSRVSYSIGRNHVLHLNYVLQGEGGISHGFYNAELEKK